MNYESSHHASKVPGNVGKDGRNVVSLEQVARYQKTNGDWRKHDHFGGDDHCGFPQTLEEEETGLSLLSHPPKGNPQHEGKYHKTHHISPLMHLQNKRTVVEF